MSQELSLFFFFSLTLVDKGQFQIIFLVNYNLFLTKEVSFYQIFSYVWNREKN